MKNKLKLKPLFSTDPSNLRNHHWHNIIGSVYKLYHSPPTHKPQPFPLQQTRIYNPISGVVLIRTR